MNTRLIISLFVVLITMGSYAQTKGSGNVKTQDRNVGNFTGIKLTCSADLYISQGSLAVSVKTDDNLLEYIETEVEDGILNIGVKGRGFRSVKVLEVHITVPDLEKIGSSGSGDIKFNDVFKANNLDIKLSGSGDLDGDFNATNMELKVVGSGDSDISGIMGKFKVSVSGSGDIDAEGLKLEDCYVKNSGSGDVTLKGKTNTLTISQNGSGDLDAYNLTAVSAIVSNSGSSDMTLHVVEKLQVTLNGSGDLTYRGTPGKVDVKSNGSGEVYKR
jgi:putative autotransporter adhesin-like protein